MSCKRFDERPSWSQGWPDGRHCHGSERMGIGKEIELLSCGILVNHLLISLKPRWKSSHLAPEPECGVGTSFEDGIDKE